MQGSLRVMHRDCTCKVLKPVDLPTRAMPWGMCEITGPPLGCNGRYRSKKLWLTVFQLAAHPVPLPPLAATKGFSIKDWCDAALSSDSLVGQSPQVRAYTKHEDFIRL